VVQIILSSVVLELIHTAKKFGFPGKLQGNVSESQVDIDLAKTLAESFERNNFNVLPCHGNSRLIQQFMTQRVFPLITYWRWKVIPGKTISRERIVSSPRNYFYTLWISGWLFDRGYDLQGERWLLLEQMSSDSLVQVIERSGLGFRKGFAQAIASERMNRRNVNTGSVLDSLVRGSMKRATFTFSTAAMPDDADYYKIVCHYLFSWAESNYVPKKD
jgi:hypothetical protein